MVCRFHRIMLMYYTYTIYLRDLGDTAAKGRYGKGNTQRSLLGYVTSTKSEIPSPTPQTPGIYGFLPTLIVVLFPVIQVLYLG